jgi:AcrR family transcriptional regulator
VKDVEVAARPLRRDAADNRERILAAAAQVFAERGPDAGVEEVARAASVGMGTLYRRFPTKQALVDELVAALRRELAAVSRVALVRSAEAGLDHLMQGAGALLYSHRGCLHQLWHQSEAGIELLEEFRMNTAELLYRAQRAGVARTELVPSDISVALWGVRGVIEMTHRHAPNAWRRHLEVTIAGLAPNAAALTHRSLNAKEVRALTGIRRGPTGTCVGPQR